MCMSTFSSSNITKLLAVNLLGHSGLGPGQLLVDTNVASLEVHHWT